MNNRKQQTDTKTSKDYCSLALAPAEEVPDPPELQRKGRKGRAKRASVEEEVDASTEEKITPGAVAEAGAFTGPRNEIPRHKASKQQSNTPTTGDADEMSSPPELVQGKHRQERERRELRENNDEEEVDASSDEEMRPGAVAVAGTFPGATGPSVLRKPRGPSARSEPSLIVAELAEASQEEEELRRRNQELEQRNQEYENVQSRVVTATVIVENNGAGDDDQNAASSAFGRKDRR